MIFVWISFITHKRTVSIGKMQVKFGEHI